VNGVEKQFLGNPLALLGVAPAQAAFSQE